MDRNEEKPAKQKSRLKITHAQNDARYVEMGKLLHLQKDPGSDGELDRMNANKNGRPYQYPDVAVMAIAGIRSIYGTLAVPNVSGMAMSALGPRGRPRPRHTVEKDTRHESAAGGWRDCNPKRQRRLVPGA